MPLRIRTESLAFAAALVALVAGLLTGSPAMACGGCVAASGATGSIVQQSERVFFHRDPATKTSTVWVEVRYSGPAKDFGWIVPLPKRPLVNVGTSYLFDRLDQATAPRFHTRVSATNENCTFDNQALGGGAGCGGGIGGMSMATRDAGPTVDTGSASHDSRVGVAGVDMIDVGEVGPYAYAIVEAKTSGSLYKWLEINGYTMPKSGEPVVESHVAKGDVFVAFRLQSGVGIDRIRPIVLTMKDVEACVPLRLTSIAAVNDMLVTVYLAGPGRAVPKNMLHVHVNPMRLAWNTGAANYPNVMSAAMDEAAGRAFVTEYSRSTTSTWVRQPQVDSSDVSTVLYEQPIADDGEWGPGALAHPHLVDTAKIGAVRSMAELRDALGYANLPIVADTAAILEQYTYGAAAEAGRNPVAFYRALRAGQGWGYDEFRKVHGRALARALDRFFVAPLHDAMVALSSSAQLTRLAMRISPAEMDRDPLFSFNSSLPDVDHVHTATIRNVCGSDASTVSGARYHIDDIDRSYVIRNGAIGVSPQTCNPRLALPALDKRFLDGPAASRVEVLDETGEPRQVHRAETELVDALIAGSLPGAPTVPKQAVLKSAGYRWEPPPSDPPEGIPEADNVHDEGPGCLSTTTAPHTTAGWLVMLALALLATKRRWT